MLHRNTHTRTLRGAPPHLVPASHQMAHLLGPLCPAWRRATDAHWSPAQFSTHPLAGGQRDSPARWRSNANRCSLLLLGSRARRPRGDRLSARWMACARGGKKRKGDKHAYANVSPGVFHTEWRTSWSLTDNIEIVFRQRGPVLSRKLTNKEKDDKRAGRARQSRVKPVKNHTEILFCLESLKEDRSQDCASQHVYAYERLLKPLSVVLHHALHWANSAVVVKVPEENAAFSSDQTRGETEGLPSSCLTSRLTSHLWSPREITIWEVKLQTWRGLLGFPLSRTDFM